MTGRGAAGIGHHHFDAIQGKLKRQGRNVGRRPSWKKAYVTLKSGEKEIEFFVEYKFDGLAVELVYENGKLISAASAP